MTSSSTRKRAHLWTTIIFCFSTNELPRRRVSVFGKMIIVEPLRVAWGKCKTVHYVRTIKMITKCVSIISENKMITTYVVTQLLTKKTTCLLFFSTNIQPICVSILAKLIIIGPLWVAWGKCKTPHSTVRTIKMITKCVLMMSENKMITTYVLTHTSML